MLFVQIISFWSDIVQKMFITCLHTHKVVVTICSDKCICVIIIITKLCNTSLKTSLDRYNIVDGL